MNLPKKHLKSTHGQILILFLLVLVLGMAIVLSVASRTVTDIKVTTTSDESNRAYFAAEAGVEEALKKAETTTSDITLRLNFPDISTTATTQLVDVGEGVRDIYVYPFLVERDDIAQVNMLGTYPVLASGWGGDLIEIYWGTDPVVAGGNLYEQAIEVSIVYWSGSSFGITKFGFDPTIHTNNFCVGATNVERLTGGELKRDGKSGIEKTVYFRTTFNIETGVVGGGASDECGPDAAGRPKHGQGTLGAEKVLLRIRPLYNTDPIPIVIEAPNPPPFVPNQGDRIESVGKTASGVTRKIEVITTYPAMPAIFDYVLFNGGTAPLKKN